MTAKIYPYTYSKDFKVTWESLYALAVESQGFVGTITEWLDSLKSGAEGKNAYQIASEEGFVGTRAEWLASLRGTDGLSIQGEKGEAGTPFISQSFTLSFLDISHKYVTLDLPVTNNQSVLVWVDGSGVLGEVGVDYSVSGQEIFWTSYLFDHLLSSGDKLRVIYY